MMKQGLIFAAAALLAAPALAANQVSLVSEVFVEKVVVAPNGRASTLLKQPDVVMPGDNLVFVVKYRNEGAQSARNFILTNPMPNAVAFREAAGEGALFSVDGGKSWGRLGELKVQGSDRRLRSARPDDVTHVRWAFRQPLPAGASGKVTFRGTVR
jgi:uncharacterized repeat protein (TIGR01451 family)